MYKSEIQDINNKIQQIRIITDNHYLRYSEIIDLWQSNRTFRTFFISLLANAPFSAYGWETPATTKNTLNKIFEFVVLDNPLLNKIPDSTAFNNYLVKNAPESIITFANLGKDALLIVPSQQGAKSSYGHLASFIRHAPEEQKHNLWQKVGAVMQKNLSDAPIWLNTAGGGVPWLHIRLDSRPKYYKYQPYVFA
ncbi:hypothetical protein [Pleurocapsa sp. PCC 7319]|uniref:DUF6940 family protein n=1 Tax=Pleurocapsa sp. PCC 7319 TaxID=118161 RepID=UPI00034D4F44|nr:hypothetical protein [Pleurocapsa sp. PCC 7319]